MVGLKALSPRFWVIPNWAVRWTYQQRETSYGEIHTIWKGGLSRTLWSLTKMRAKSCTWDNITKEPCTGWDLCSWQAALLKRTWGSWWTSWAWVSVLLHQQRQIGSWATSAGILLAELEMWSSHSAQRLLDRSWSTLPSFGTHVSGKT